MQLSDTELIRKAQGGNTSAFEELVFRHDRKVLAIAARYVTSADDAKDIYQEVFLRVFRNLKKFEFRSEFGTWLHRITVNVCMTHRTRREVQKHTTTGYGTDEEEGESHDAGVADTIAPDDASVASEISTRVNEALESLAPQQKLVFTLRHYEGYKLREIAGMMQCTEGTVKRYLFLATQQMRELLRGYYED